MKASKRSSRALKILLRFSLFLATKKKAQVAPKDAEELVVLAANFAKLSPKKYNQLVQLERKYLPKEA